MRNGVEQHVLKLVDSLGFFAFSHKGGVCEEVQKCLCLVFPVNSSGSNHEELVLTLDLNVRDFNILKFKLLKIKHRLKAFVLQWGVILVIIMNMLFKRFDSLG